MEQLCSTQQVSVSSFSFSKGSWTTRQADRSEEACGRVGENGSHKKKTKQHKLTVNEHGSRQQGVGWAQNGGGWLRQGASRPQTRRFNISNHSHCLEPQWGYYGILRHFFSSLTLSLTDSYLHWLTLGELEACWEGGRQTNWLSSSWLMAGFVKNGRPAAHHHFSPQIAWKLWILNVLAEMHELGYSILTLSFP